MPIMKAKWIINGKPQYSIKDWLVRILANPEFALDMSFDYLPFYNNDTVISEFIHTKAFANISTKCHKDSLPILKMLASLNED